MACEKCWADACWRWMFVDPFKTQVDHYHDLLAERKDSPCTPAQQHGEQEVRIDAIDQKHDLPI